MRIVYFGTPEFAVSALESIIKSGHKVEAVVTQPDKAKGRSNKLVPTPVKEKALENRIEVYQPEKVRNEEFIDVIKSIKPDAIVVAAFGQILPESILAIPQYGCINIHASLLPRLRGAAPIERAILDGDEKTGVTTMYMAKGLDTGDIIDCVEVPIEPSDTALSLTEKLAKCGAELVLDTLSKLEKNTATRTKQDDSKSTYASMLNKEMGRIDFTESAEYIERMTRGLYPWPCAYTQLDGRSMKIIEASVVNKIGTPGEVIEVTKKNFTVACGEKAITINKLQPEGKKIMDASAFLNGYKMQIGMKLG